MTKPTPPYRSLLAALLAVAVLVTACGSDAGRDVEAIATNNGGVLVKPPDVLAGETEVVDGRDTAAVPNPDASADNAATAPANDALAAPAAEFVWFDGSSGSVGALAGRPTVLNFWASTCAACIAEMPEFEEAYQLLIDDVAFVGMNTGDRRDAADRLAEQTGVTYPLAEDPNGDVFRAFGGFVMPTTIFLDADGHVAYTWSGVLTGNELRLLVDEHIAPGTYENV